MKKTMLLVALTLVGLTACVATVMALYRWVTEGDKVTCVAHEFAFGCTTTLGWLLTVVGVVVVSVAALWSHFRDR